MMMEKKKKEEKMAICIERERKCFFPFVEPKKEVDFHREKITAVLARFGHHDDDCIARVRGEPEEISRDHHGSPRECDLIVG